MPCRKSAVGVWSAAAEAHGSRILGASETSRTLVVELRVEGVERRVGHGRRSLACRLVLLETASQLRQLHRALALEVQAGAEAVASESLPHAGNQHLEDDVVVLELNLRLGRMYVDVYRLRVHLQEDEIGRRHPFREELLVRLHHRLVQVGTAEVASVHEEILVAEGSPGALRAAGKAAYLDHRSVGGNVYHISHHVSADYVRYPEFQRLGLLEHEDLAAVVGERETNFRPGNRHPRELLHNVLELHLVRLEELASGGGVVEEIAHGEIGALRRGDGRGLYGFVAPQGDLGAGFFFCPAGAERNLRHRRDAGQGLPAEAVGLNALEVCGAGNLGRGVTLEAEHGVRGAHTAAVVYHLDEGAPGVGNYHVHLGGSGIHGVLHQLLDHGRGPLYHLSGGNHIGYPCRQYFQASHSIASGRT